MIHRIEEIEALPEFIIRAKFSGGEIKEYSMESLFSQFPQFNILKEDIKLYEQVQADVGGYGIFWNDDLDLSAETIWEEGILVETVKEADLNRLLAYHLLLAREEAHMTQKELAEKTGIYQADISRIERGLGNPSLSTLKRLASGLGKTLEIKLY